MKTIINKLAAHAFSAKDFNYKVGIEVLDGAEWVIDAVSKELREEKCNPKLLDLVVTGSQRNLELVFSGKDSPQLAHLEQRISLLGQRQAALGFSNLIASAK